MISFKTTATEQEMISSIAERAIRAARKVSIEYPFVDAMMDITAVHANGMPLRLAELLEADDFDFNHDIFGIRRHLDRQTGTLRDCFVPRHVRQ